MLHEYTITESIHAFQNGMASNYTFSQLTAFAKNNRTTGCVRPWVFSQAVLSIDADNIKRWYHSDRKHGRTICGFRSQQDGFDIYKLINLFPETYRMMAPPIGEACVSPNLPPSPGAVAPGSPRLNCSVDEAANTVNLFLWLWEVKTQGYGSVYYFRRWKPWKCILLSELKTLEVGTMLRPWSLGRVYGIRKQISRPWKCILFSKMKTQSPESHPSTCMY